MHRFIASVKSCISETRQGWRADSRTLKIQPLDMADDGDMVSAFRLGVTTLHCEC